MLRTSPTKKFFNCIFWKKKFHWIFWTGSYIKYLRLSNLKFLSTNSNLKNNVCHNQNQLQPTPIPYTMYPLSFLTKTYRTQRGRVSLYAKP